MYTCSQMNPMPMQIDPEIKSICNHKFKITCSPEIFAIAAIGSSILQIVHPTKTPRGFHGSVKLLSHIFLKSSIFLVGALTMGVMLNVFSYKKTKSIEAKSMRNISNGIVLNIKCSHDSDHNGASDYKHHDMINSKIYAKKYAVISKRVSDDDSVSETFLLIDEYSKKGSIKVLVFSGHGNSEGIKMGSQLGGKICKFHSPRIEKTLSKTADDAVIILDSCSTSKGSDNVATHIRWVAHKRKVYASSKTIQGYILRENLLSKNKNFPYTLYFETFDGLKFPWIKQE